MNSLNELVVLKLWIMFLLGQVLEFFLYNTRIGSNVIIGSGSLVNKDIPDNSVYAGVPAKFICTFDEYIEKAKDYSCEFKKVNGVDKPGGVNDELAHKMYEKFLTDRC